MKFMKLSLDFHQMDCNVDFVDIEGRNLLRDCYKEIGCDLVDMVDIDDKFTAIIDDEGLLKSNNPVFEFSNGINLVGNILIATTTEMNDNFEKELSHVSIDNAFEFFMKYKVKPIGMTK